MDLRNHGFWRDTSQVWDDMNESVWNMAIINHSKPICRHRLLSFSACFAVVFQSEGARSPTSKVPTGPKISKWHPDNQTWPAGKPMKISYKWRSSWENHRFLHTPFFRHTDHEISMASGMTDPIVFDVILWYLGDCHGCPFIFSLGTQLAYVFHGDWTRPQRKRAKILGAYHGLLKTIKHQ